ncbi:MAG: hypothetical protein JO223_13845 [Hyphomicrobiales bacterium]|nr:hypothetical protein [Hyphomicrobiales bacterium]MBV8439371.1 hypothetical protein [Hyphomicrobiales bacterium]
MDLVREGLRFQFVGELPELIDIDARPETEGMRDRLRRGRSPSRNGLAQAGAKGSIDGLLERDAELLRALLEQARQVVVERQGRAHDWHH